MDSIAAGVFSPPAREARLRPKLWASTGAERTRILEHRSAAKTQAPTGSAGVAEAMDSRSSDSWWRLVPCLPGLPQKGNDQVPARVLALCCLTLGTMSCGKVDSPVALPPAQLAGRRTVGF